MLVKVIAMQARMGRELSLAEKIRVFRERPDFVCLPEYWLLDETIGDFQRAALRRVEQVSYLTALSDQLATCLIGGTVIEAEGARLFNSCPVINRGSVLGRYRKRHPVTNEAARGINPGTDELVLDVDGVRIGVMVCGDVFHPERYDDQARRQVDIVFIPTTSPYRAGDSQAMKNERDHKYFVEGARRSGAYAVKTCGVGDLLGRPLQGRSLIAAPWGILSRIDSRHESDPQTITEILDIDELRDFRSKSRPRGAIVGTAAGTAERNQA